MNGGITSRDASRARWIGQPVLEGGELSIRLPYILDSVNARLLRKMVLSRLPECLSIKIDADDLNQLGNIGAAALWQILSSAKGAGVHVEVLNVTQHIHDELLKIKRAEDLRQSCQASADEELIVIVDDTFDTPSQKSSLRLRKVTDVDNRIAHKPAPVAKRGLLGLPLRKRKAA